MLPTKLFWLCINIILLSSVLSVRSQTREQEMIQSLVNLTTNNELKHDGKVLSKFTSDPTTCSPTPGGILNILIYKNDQ